MHLLWNLKFITKERKKLDETIKPAFMQTEAKKYTYILEAKDIPAQCIQKYGFAFKGKNVLIGRT